MGGAGCGSFGGGVMGEHYFSERPSSPDRRGLVRARLRGMDLEFLTSSGVFSVRRVDRGTRLLVESMVLPEGGRVLDMGCGYGVVGVVAGRLVPGLEVWMTDVNERAVSLARLNVKRNGVIFIYQIDQTVVLLMARELTLIEKPMAQKMCKKLCFWF